ncbi:hypothetical protein BGZ93_004122 [Podila epicladia]|nr:hypothetical protein BGZ93_004122 [Podila epicladia]
MPGYATAAHRDTFTHLGVKLKQGGRDMVQIEQDTLAGLRRTMSTWHRRHLTKAARVVIANTYFLSKLWHVAPFYDFSSKFFDEIDRLVKLLIWDGKARVSLAWHDGEQQGPGAHGGSPFSHQVPRRTTT